MHTSSHTLWKKLKGGLLIHWSAPSPAFVLASWLAGRVSRKWPRNWEIYHLTGRSPQVEVVGSDYYLRCHEQGHSLNFIWGCVGGAANESSWIPPEGWADCMWGLKALPTALPKKEKRKSYRSYRTFSPLHLLFTYKLSVLELMWVHMWQAYISILNCSSKVKLLLNFYSAKTFNWSGSSPHISEPLPLFLLRWGGANYLFI